MHKQVSFSASAYSGADSRVPRVEFEIDGQPLIGLIRNVETVHARREGAEALAGNYAWPLLSLRLLRLLSGDVGEGILLNCPCGLPDCWPLSIIVKVQARTVTWAGITQLRRPGVWDYRTLEPLRFCRRAYVEQIAHLRLTHRQIRPSRSRIAADHESTATLACAL
jgi:hypothetical protein